MPLQYHSRAAPPLAAALVLQLSSLWQARRAACVFYVALALLKYRLTRAWSYPILEHIHGPAQWLGFLLAVTAFVCVNIQFGNTVGSLTDFTKPEDAKALSCPTSRSLTHGRHQVQVPCTSTNGDRRGS